MPVSFDAGDVIAGLAFLLSVYATRQTVSFNKKQKNLVESQERLNNRLLEKEDEDALKGKRADLSASFIKLGNSKYQLKIWNKGATTARNVRLEFPEGSDVVIDSEVKDKFPIESLERLNPYNSSRRYICKPRKSMLFGSFGKMMRKHTMKSFLTQHCKIRNKRQAQGKTSRGTSVMRVVASGF